MKALRRALRSRSGMTLVELILAMILLAVIGTTVAASLVPTLNAYNNTNSVAEMNALMDNLTRDFLSDLGKAREVTLSGTGELTIKTDLTSISYGVDADGYLYRDTAANLVFPKGYYKKKTISIAYQTTSKASSETEPLAPGFYGKDSKFSILVQVSLYDKGSQMVTRSYAVKPLGMNQYDVQPESGWP